MIILLLWVLNMVNGTNRAEIEAELNTPESRRIIVAYNNAEIERFDKCGYFSLGKKYPSVNNYLEELRAGYDPIEKIKEVKRIILAGRLQISRDFFDLLGKQESDQEKQLRKDHEEKFSNFCDANERLIQIREPFYVKLATAVKSVSNGHGISVDETVKNVQYLDSVLRIVHPTRQDAESFLRTYTSLEMEILEHARRLNSKIMPTRKAVDAVQKATIDYKMKEIDRVYASRN